MSANLNQTNIEIDDPNFKDVFSELQGNILKSHGRDYSRHIFFTFHGTSAENRAWVQDLSSEITSALEQNSQSEAYKTTQKHQLFVNFMLSCSGYLALSIPEHKWPTDKAFRSGMKDLQTCYDTAPRGDHKPTSNPLNDSVEEWESGFQSDIDGMILIAYSDEANNSADHILDQKIIKLKAQMQGVADIIFVQEGHVMRNDKEQVIEHFGFVDGVSNPKFLYSELNEEFNNGAYSRNDPSASLNTVMVKDPAAGPNGYGSYVTYRKLQQNMKGFWQKLDLLANTLSEVGEQKINADYAGALCVGRFKDGTPISEQGKDGWTNLFNNFNYNDDVNGSRCPFQSHTRKTNPRGDTVRQFNSPPTIEQSRRLVRRGISFGSTELNPNTEWTDAGLLFISLQASIVDQFIFMQHTWCNNEGFIREKTGIDPLVGQLLPGEKGAAQSWPSKWGNANNQVDFEFSGFVRNLGGEYFFLPSINFLNNLSALD